jgi:hypothetical protein
MKSKTPIILLALFSLTFPQQAVAASQAKAGAKCTKVNSTQTVGTKKFTCVKHGKKLIWDKGINLARPEAPTSTNTIKSFVPWTTNATGKEISDAAQKNFRDWAKDQANKPLNHQFIIEDGVLPDRAKSLTAADMTGSRLFSQFFSTKSITVIGSSFDWVVQKLNTFGGNFTSCSLTYVQGAHYCFDGVALQGMVILSDKQFDPFNLRSDGSSLLAHEYFHLVQTQLANPDRYMIKDGSSATEYLFPAWLIEGTAEFTGYSVAALSMGSEYWQSRETMYTPINRNSLEDAEIRIFEGTQPNGPIDPYGIGRMATEYLVASVGYQKVLDIFATFKETKDFEKSFEKATGVSKKFFYEKFELVRTKLGMPEVSMKLVCLTNLPLKDIPKTLPKCVISGTQPTTSATRPAEETPSARAPDDLNQLICTLENQVVFNSVGEFRCLKINNRLQWSKNNLVPSS